MKPFITEDLIKINPNCTITNHGNYLVIDDYFENYDLVYETLKSLPFENWKMGENTRNFIDYYDCRPVIHNTYPLMEKLASRNSVLNYLLSFLNKRLAGNSLAVNFNCFQPIKKYQIHQQHTPHTDGKNIYNMVTFIDQISDGGLALYDINYLNNDEHKNLIIDISKFKLNAIIPSKPNRCVVLNGETYHGGFIRNYKSYEDNWRVTAAQFLKVEDND